MAQVAQYAGKKLLAGQMKKRQQNENVGRYDPKYEWLYNPKDEKHPIKVEKKAPTYLSKHDAKILQACRRRAHRYDTALGVGPFRFGISGLVGFIPGAGDAVDGALALSLYKKIRTIDGGLPPRVAHKMKIYIVMDILLGLIPIAGDIADMVFKCNGRNVRLLEEYLEEKYNTKDLEGSYNDVRGDRRDDRRRERSRDDRYDDRYDDQETGTTIGRNDRPSRIEPSRNGTKGSRR